MWLAEWRSRLEDRRYERGKQKHAQFLLRVRQREERARLGFYQEGFKARVAGKPCSPPGYPPIADYDPDEEPFYGMRYQAWAEGWETADRERTQRAD